MKRPVRLLAILVLGFLASCDSPKDDYWLGYIEGELALMAPPQPGWITSIDVMRGAKIKRGDALFTLDAVRELAARDNANAAIAAANEQASQAASQIAEAQAEEAQVDTDMARNEKELARQQELVRTGATPRRDLETAQAAYDSARAHRIQTVALQTQAAAARRQAEAQAHQAEANLTTAEFNLSERTVHAQLMGEVQDIYFRQGEYANARAPVVAERAPCHALFSFFAIRAPS